MRLNIPDTYTCDVCHTTGLLESDVMYVSIQVGRNDRSGTGEYAPRDGFARFDVCKNCLGGSAVIKTFWHTRRIDIPAKRLLGWLFPKN